MSRNYNPGAAEDLSYLDDDDAGPGEEGPSEVADPFPTNEQEVQQ